MSVGAAELKDPRAAIIKKVVMLAIAVVALALVLTAAIRAWWSFSVLGSVLTFFSSLSVLGSVLAFISFARPDPVPPGRGKPPVSPPDPRPVHEAAMPRSPQRYTVLFLAADPKRTNRLALNREVRRIKQRLEDSARQDPFELAPRWVTNPNHLREEVTRLKPEVVHFSGQGGRAGQDGVFLETTGGYEKTDSAAALATIFQAAAGSVKLVLLDACYDEAQAVTLLAYVDHVVGMSGSSHSDTAKRFAIEFYKSLGRHEVIEAAYRQACTAVGAENLPLGDRPQRKVRSGIDAGQPLPGGASAAPLSSLARTEQIDFKAERERHAPFVGFVGREDVLGKLDEWLYESSEVGWVVVTGGPGMGKSAIVSKWLEQHEKDGDVVPHHFIRRQTANWNQPDVIAVSLSARIESEFPDLCDPQAKPERRLHELLLRVSTQLGSSGRLVIVIDGLDQTHAESNEVPLSRFLPDVLPRGIRFLCAMRPVEPYLDWMAMRAPVRRLDLDDVQWKGSNDAVVSGFWQAVASGYDPPLQAATIDIAISSAEGNILHAEGLHGMWRDLPASERSTARVPRGPSALLDEIWNRATSHEGVREGLGLLCAAREALPLDVLAHLARWSSEQRKQFVRNAREFLLQEPAAWGHADAYRPRHDWMREVMAGWLGAAALRCHHRTLMCELAVWPPPATRLPLLEEQAGEYAKRHALAHRLAAADWEGVQELVLNLGYLEARAARPDDVFAVEQELLDAAKEAIRQHVDPALTRRLNDLALAFAHESHWIRENPTETCGRIWNRLRRSGWTKEELEARVKVPENAAFLRIRHVGSQEDACGHAEGVTALALTPDGRRLISASADRTLKIWDVGTGRVLATHEGLANAASACAVTIDGKRIVLAFHDGTLEVRNLDDGQFLTRLEGDAGAVNACVVTTDGRRAVSASGARTLKVWDLNTGRVITELPGHTDVVNACAVTPDGSRVVSASADCTLHLRHLDGSDALTTFDGHAGVVNACAVTPDGMEVVSASDDGTLKVWELDTARVRRTLKGHAGVVSACAVAPDGLRVISASADRSVKLWDLATGGCLFTYCGNTPFQCVVATASSIIVGDRAGKVSFLELPLEPFMARREDRAGGSGPSGPAANLRSSSMHTSTAVISLLPSKVDIGILTIREDELRAVLGVFPDKIGIARGAHREYTLRHADAGNGERYTIAVLRQIEWGNGEAQNAARDLIADLSPRLVLVVGIASGLPSDEVKLGDVILSTRIQDFSLEARKTGQEPSYDAAGGPIDQALAAAVMNLPGREDELGDWTATLPSQPPVTWTRKGQLYGESEWQHAVRDKLEHHHGADSTPRGPRYVAGRIASSDRVIEDPELLFPWIKTSRNILAIEMESGGVYRAARGQCSMLAIRGISDIVGLKREPAWARFACLSAAAFTRAFLRTRPVPAGSLSPAAPQP